MSIKTISQNQINWHHLDQIDNDALNFFKKNFKFHALDIKDVQGQVEESKLDIYQNYLFLILQFPLLNRATGRIEHTELDVFLGANYLVTIHKGERQSMRDFYYRMQNNQKFRKICMSQGPGYLLYRLLDHLYQDTKFITNYVDKKTKELEDQVYSDQVNENTAREIAYLRRKILSLKRIFEPQLEVMETLSKLKNNYFESELNVYFDDIDDYVDKVWNSLDNRKYVMKDLLEVHESLLTHTTNKVIKILTVISVSILPLTLLSGIYGMNIDLPFDHSPLIVWGIFGILMMAIFIVVLFFKQKKWL